MTPINVLIRNLRRDVTVKLFASPYGEQLFDDASAEYWSRSGRRVASTTYDVGEAAAIQCSEEAYR